MKRLILAGFLFCMSGFISAVNADSHTVIVDYAYTQIPDFNSLQGANIKYRYEWGSRLNVMGSFTAMEGSESYSGSNVGGKTSINYYSLTAGPGYYVNQYLVVYGLLGVSYSKVMNGAAWGIDHFGNSGSASTLKENNLTMAYNFGFLFTPTENFVVDVGYEGSEIDIGTRTRNVNGIALGVGYRF